MDVNIIDKQKNVIKKVKEFNNTKKGKSMAGLVSIIAQALVKPKMIEVRQTPVVQKKSSNPFEGDFTNPFVASASSTNPFRSYGQNRPVQGGYFAGYYNNKPNIVGQRLFIEV